MPLICTLFRKRNTLIRALSNNDEESYGKRYVARMGRPAVCVSNLSNLAIGH